MSVRLHFSAHNSLTQTVTVQILILANPIRFAASKVLVKTQVTPNVLVHISAKAEFVDIKAAMYLMFHLALTTYHQIELLKTLFNLH